MKANDGDLKQLLIIKLWNLKKIHLLMKYFIDFPSQTEMYK